MAEVGSNKGSSGIGKVASEGLESCESNDLADTAGDVDCIAGCLTCMGRFCALMLVICRVV